MDRNEYTLALLVRTKLEDARAASARRHLVPRRPGIRVRLGTVLGAVGRRLQAGEVAARRGRAASCLRR